MIEPYFAIDPKVEDLQRLMDDYYDTMSSLGWDTMINKSYAYYYGRGQHATAAGIAAGGKQGEISELMSNEYRSFLRYMLTLVTSERPAFDVRATNTDHKSETQAVVGEQVLEFYMRHNKLEDLLRDACEKSLWSSEGFIGVKWDVQGGEVYTRDPEAGTMVMKGDVAYRTYNSLQVIRDPYCSNHSYDWVILVDYENKYDMAAQYPEHAEHLVGLSMDSYNDKYRLGMVNKAKTNKIPIFTLYHKKSPALPEGRWVVYTSEEILAEGPLPYEDIPVYRIAPGNLDGYVFGYSPAFDILGLQEANDDLFSSLLTNNRNFAKQLIGVDRGAGVSHRVLTEGSTLLEMDLENNRSISDIIQPIQLTKSSPEAYQFLDTITARMEKYTGINEVIRGEPSPNLRSGNALALIAAQAIKFNSGLQQSYNLLIEDVGTATLRFLKQFAQAPRFFRIVGKTNRSMLKEFSSNDLEGVDRVDVQRASALTSTTAGRIELADNLLAANMIKRPEQYINVLETGRLDPLIESERSELLNIKSENEMMLGGEQPIAILTDNHELHIREHRAVLDDPEARKTPDVVQATLAHMEEHRLLWQKTPPEFLLASKQQPAPVPPMPPQGQQPAPQGGANPGALEPMTPEEQIPTPAPAGMPPAAAPEDLAAYNQLGLNPAQ